MGMRYIDFLDLNYEPRDTDVICTFHVEPWNISVEEASGAVAAESSVGTWTELTTVKPYVQRLRATVFRIEAGEAKIAYPMELFERGNIPNIMSSVAGNIFGLAAVKNLKLEDIELPRRLTEASWVRPTVSKGSAASSKCMTAL